MLQFGKRCNRNWKKMAINNYRVENEEQLSRMSAFLRLLLKISFIPLALDETMEKITFRMWSRQTAYFLLYFLMVATIMDVGIFYIWGLDNFLDLFINMYKDNTTDFLTYCVLLIFSAGSNFQFKQFYGISKISSELVLAKNLRWPKQGTILLFITILCLISQIIWCVCIVKARSKINFMSFIWLTVGYTFSFLYSYTIVFILFIFYLTWMEHFSVICEERNDTTNCIQQTQKCLHIYKSIQDGLGATFSDFFLSFQIIIVITLYMCISTAFFGPYDTLSNTIVSICYAIMFLYCGTSLYTLILAAERSYVSLQTLVKPLTISMMRENDTETKIEIQLLLKEIEKVPPLNGNGYFELKKETLTSITSTTVTYLIILLQFRNS